MVTLVHTPRLNGEGYFVGRFLSVLNPRVRATAFDRLAGFVLPFLINWLIVDMYLNKKLHSAVPPLYYYTIENARLTKVTI